MSSLQSFLAAANDLQIKGLTAPTVNSFRKNRSLEVDHTAGTPAAKKIKKERSESESNKVNRSLLKRRNTEEIKQEDDVTQTEEDPDSPEDTLDSQQQPEENSYEELSQDRDGASFHLEDGHFSGSQTDDVAAGQCQCSLVSLVLCDLT